MYLDFHTHGKLAKYLPFSVPYTRCCWGRPGTPGWTPSA